MYRKSQHWLNNNRPLCAREQNEHHIEVFLASPTPLSPFSWKDSAILLSLAVSKLSHMVSFSRLPPKFQQIWAQLTDSPLYTEGRTSLNREGGTAHPEGAQKAGCGLSVAEGSFIKRWQTSGWGCRAIRRIIVLKCEEVAMIMTISFKWCHQSANEVVALFSPC